MPTPQKPVSRDRFNVLWKPKTADKANAQAKAHGLKHIPYDQIDAQTDWRVYELPPGIAKKSEEWIRAHPHFGGEFEPEGFAEEIEPVSLVPVDGGQAHGVAEGDQWYQTFVKAPQAWSATRGAGAVGAVTDNGLGPHPFTDPRVVESKIFDLAETDLLGGSHGNPVTGCCVGIAPAGGVTNYKIAGADTRCSWTDMSNAWLHAKSKARKVVNVSYGGGSSILAAQTAATLKQAGIAIICAAGNAGTATMFPASNVNCYAVSSVATSGEISGFSCRGKIDICAPGEGLLTTTSGGGWAHFSGTSGAAPIITGLVLLILSKNPTWTGVQAVEHLMATATPKLPATDYGAGIPNAAKALGVADTVPVPVPVPPPTTDPTPPPVVEPPPPTTEPPADKANVNSLAQWTSSLTNQSTQFGSEQLPQLTDGRMDTKCLWFSARPWVQAAFSESVTLVDIDLVSGNDAPERDPKRLLLSVDGGPDYIIAVPAFSGRRVRQTIHLSSPTTGKVFRFAIENTSGSITQITEMVLLGAKSGTTTPTVETWTPVREVITTSLSDWTPTTAQQSATKTESVRYYEKSNLGNVRKDETIVETTTATRSVDLPVK